MKKNVEQLKISYFRYMIDSCSDIRFGYRKKLRVVRRYEDKKRVEERRIHTKRGKELIALRDECEYYMQVLKKLESEWINKYGTPCESVKVKPFKRTLNRRRFDSFKERCNTYESNTSTFYNGKKYKSKLESDFAKLMDEYGIPYKYEPEITYAGTETMDPDFIIYLPWLDLLILVEIFGACADVKYLKRNRLKLHYYMLEEWIPGWNMLALYYTDKTPYIREMVIEEIENIEIRKYLSVYN
ncbi:MAG: hypothetical protein J6X33_02700 [Clostridiales bacterium]|nr:hypothetical protein [Clostridiales bacterium]